MPTLDVFRSDAFSVLSLTDAILKAPFKPGRIGELGLFRSRGITTTVVMVEEKDGRLTLIPTSPRGGPGSSIGASKRAARSFVVPHLERDSTILADEVQNVRSFGSENAQDAVQALINERLADLRGMHEATLEHLRASALQGIILDSDGSTPIYNLFTEFGVAQQAATIDTTAEMRRQIVAAERLIETELGAEPISGYRALCGDDFFDILLDSSDVKTSFQYQEGSVLRADLRKGFQFGGVSWENYRGSVGGVAFFAADEAYLFPEGTSIFGTYFAPADFIETVNTVGLPIYAKQSVDDQLGRWAKIHTQSNPLALCLRPRAVVKLTLST